MNNKFWKKEKGLTLIELVFVILIITIIMIIVTTQVTGYKMVTFNSSAQNELRKAYKTALMFFTDNPNGTLTPVNLKTYGYKTSDTVNLKIMNGTSSGLRMTSSHIIPGADIYTIDCNGSITSEASPLIQLASIGMGGANESSSGEQEANSPSAKENEQNNKTEASGSSPSNKPEVTNDQGSNDSAGAPDSTRTPYNAVAKNELQQAYSAAQAYFHAHPEGTLTKDVLKAYGYTPSENVNLSLSGGTFSSLSMTASSNMSGGQSFTIDSKGNITP